jgi:hypothetical protein
VNVAQNHCSEVMERLGSLMSALQPFMVMGLHIALVVANSLNTSLDWFYRTCHQFWILRTKWFRKGQNSYKQRLFNDKDRGMVQRGLNGKRTTGLSSKGDDHNMH